MSEQQDEKKSGFSFNSELPPSSILLALGVSLPEGGVTVNHADALLLIDALKLMSKNGLRLSSIDNASMDELKLNYKHNILDFSIRLFKKLLLT